MIIISGVFFQNQQWIGLAMRPVDGLVPIIESGLIRSCFSGMILETPPGVYVGGIFDHYGESEIFDIEFCGIGSQRLSFTKKYRQRPDSIKYTFTKKDDSGIFVGEFSGELVGSGTAKCVLTEVSDNFLLPE